MVQKDETKYRTLWIAALLLSYLFAGMYSFDWQSPIIKNNVAWSEKGTLVFYNDGIAKTPIPPIWVQEAHKDNLLKVSLRVRTFSYSQAGPARILSNSLNTQRRNLTIAQDYEDLIVRLRSTATDLNGLPEMRVESVFASASWKDIELIIGENYLDIFVDGHIRLSKSLQNSVFDQFDSSYFLAIGNELTGDRGWKGEVSRAQIEAGAQVFDYLKTDAIETPRYLHWYHQKPVLNPFKTSNLPDVLLNFFGFIPFGLIAYIQLGVDGRRHAIVLALGFFTSLTIETSQWLLPDRYPSTSDLMLNTIGTATGIAICVIYRRVKYPA